MGHSVRPWDILRGIYTYANAYMPLCMLLLLWLWNVFHFYFMKLHVRKKRISAESYVLHVKTLSWDNFFQIICPLLEYAVEVKYFSKKKLELLVFMLSNKKYHQYSYPPTPQHFIYVEETLSDRKVEEIFSDRKVEKNTDEHFSNLVPLHASRPA